ncbi:anthranilate phosphoribosyltransferase [Arthrobacter roseus]|uniref:anthranilate phosphoribosyltransferase n=1 Tax=Arthrobacter roseus TaxID=136274 RepID=UPI001963EF40|nr:anthranilate phosphoribosyltransferase [Arthrobacter roseus]
MVSDISGSNPPVYTWPQLFGKLVEGKNLASGETAWAMENIMDGGASPSRLAAFLMGLAAKGETVEELTGLTEAMLARAHRISVRGPALDIVGTGGDGLETLNISTMSSLVVVGAGLKVVKHGNRGASSASGAADVIEALGVRLDLPVERVAEVADEVGITFCFAQVFHPSMRHAAVTRRDMGIRTAFNVLGPLTNPARVGYQALGVADSRMAPLMAGVLARRGTQALVFRGSDGRDKMTTSGPSHIWDVREGIVTPSTVSPSDFGLDVVPVDALKGRDPSYNASVVRSVLAGDHGPVRDAVVLNAAAGMAAADTTATGLASERIRANLDAARYSIDSGAASAVLDRWVEATQ